MSIKKEEVIKILDEISAGIDSIGVNNNKKDFKSIYREAFIKYKGAEGRLVWDYDIFVNELTFIDSRNGKHYSLGEEKDDGKVAEIFYFLAKEYGIID